MNLNKDMQGECKFSKMSLHDVNELRIIYTSTQQIKV